jgi:transposase
LSPLGVLFHFDGLAVEEMVVNDGTITLVVVATTDSAACPNCHVASTRVHSRYWRTLHDLPWADVAVTLRRHVRRFRCINPSCLQAIFAERFSSLAQVHARGRWWQMADLP